MDEARECLFITQGDSFTTHHFPSHHPASTPEVSPHPVKIFLQLDGNFIKGRELRVGASGPPLDVVREEGLREGEGRSERERKYVTKKTYY